MVHASLHTAKQPHNTSVVLLICASALNFLHDEMKQEEPVVASFVLPVPKEAAVFNVCHLFCQPVVTPDFNYCFVLGRMKLGDKIDSFNIFFILINRGVQMLLIVPTENVLRSSIQFEHHEMFHLYLWSDSCHFMAAVSLCLLFCCCNSAATPPPPTAWRGTTPARMPGKW